MTHWLGFCGEHVTHNLPGEGVRHFMFLPDGRLAGEYDGASGAVIAEYLWLGDALVGEVSAAGVITSVQIGPLRQPLTVLCPPTFIRAELGRGLILIMAQA